MTKAIVQAREDAAIARLEAEACAIAIHHLIREAERRGIPTPISPAAHA